MTGPQAGLDRLVSSALDDVSARIPFVLGGCGTGRTSMAERLCARLGAGAAQYVDVERTATTPERFLHAVTAASPFAWTPEQAAASPRASFDALLAFLSAARGPADSPATFVFDEVLELKTFESFPGLRHVMREFLAAIALSPNRFVLTSRYQARALRLIRDAAPRFEAVTIAPLTASDVTDALAPVFDHYEQMATEDRDQLGRTVQVITDGRLGYVARLGEAMADTRGRSADPVLALTSLLMPGASLERQCRYSYELRLHRARGYGALKAILDILAEDEGLTLTEISLRLRRTPGSTKDYLSWLEDVDLVTAKQKRYSFADPLLRAWVRIHCRVVRPSADDVMREVQRYVRMRTPVAEPVQALAYAGGDSSADDRKNWGIIEID